MTVPDPGAIDRDPLSTATLYLSMFSRLSGRGSSFTLEQAVRHEISRRAARVLYVMDHLAPGRVSPACPAIKRGRVIL
jgi:hypothetical protein